MATPDKNALKADEIEKQKSFRKAADKVDPPTVNVPMPAPQKDVKSLDPRTGVSQMKKEKNPNVKVNLKEMIKQHLLAGAKKMDYSTDEILSVLEVAKASFAKQPSLIEMPAPINICGDIHGQYTDLMRVFNSCGLPFKKNFLFLGDYVDRGHHSLEVIMLLMACKVKFPDNIWLLRGNHELKNINRVYGFRAELRQRYRQDGEMLHNEFNDVFAQMPFAALVQSKILCMHGGLSPLIKSMDDIRKITRGKHVLDKDSIEQDLVWADPEYGVRGFQKNELRGVSYYFGPDAIKDMCQKLNIDMIVRAHQVVEFGYSFFANRSLVTVFTAARYHPDTPNYGGIVQVSKNMEISFLQLKPKEGREVGEVEKKIVRTMDCDEEDDHKDK
ncbi:unnamed protein product [Bursaphelenchus okinawaensis]|uniref:Serine/threonine-protein phosphatase n=1 Tax=Bursaphelenchus okinawaensis TaxID=465554 RepID=A0A811JQJ8_9BILA|nr:unnamed protein product [Bursaphelenchus okinawaensis]CAG9078012.1 unnamed protein product [Bursaphelenchus okinawaensis]